MTAQEWQARCELAALYRVVDLWGWSDLLATHISARVPGEQDQFLINPFGLLFDEVTASNLVKVDGQGRVLAGEHPVNPAGFLIHSCIHRARADVDCVLHLHSRDGTAVATQQAGLLPATQHALIIWDQIAYHDFEGVVLDAEEQVRLVADLADKRILLLRNHGTLTAGRSIAEAFLLMYRLERACRMQLAAQAGGAPLRLLDQEVVRTTLESGRQLYANAGFTASGDETWQAVLRRLQRQGVRYDV